MPLNKETKPTLQIWFAYCVWQGDNLKIELQQKNYRNDFKTVFGILGGSFLNTVTHV